MGYKPDSFGDRQKRAEEARKALVERFKARPSKDDPAFIARQEELKRVEEARQARHAERQAAKEAEARAKAEAEAARIAEEQARAVEEARHAAEEKARILAEQKAARDARYAARKARRK